MVRPTFRPTPSRLPLALAAAFALTLAACGGDADQEAVVVDEAAPGVVATDEVAAEPVVMDEAETDVVETDAVAVDTLEPAATDGAMASGGWQSLQDDWETSVPSVQARFGELSEEELLATGGDREELVMLVQQKYNLEPGEAEQQVSDFEATL